MKSLNINRFCLYVLVTLTSLCVFVIGAVSAVGASYGLGDVNLDGKINVKDATVIQKHVADISVLNEPSYSLADYDGDSRVTVRDATLIQKVVAGIINVPTKPTGGGNGVVLPDDEW